MDILIAIYLSFICGLAYRFRGGGYLPTGSNTLVRFAWGISLAMTYACLSRYWSFPWLILGGFLSMMVPHGFCQNAGLWPRPGWMDKSPKQRWPAVFLPQWTEEGWGNAPMWQRAAYDGLQMACVGFFRALIIFGPLALINHYAGYRSTASAFFTAVGSGAVLQALAYQAGVHWIPRRISELIADDWAPEFLAGMAWAVSLAVYCAM